ncbi:MAG: prolipoprotein diacylglyceryl transferase, partial [Bdellovibrionota bacterium]
MTDTSSAWVHNLDPFLVQFSGTVGIRWYGLAYLTAFVLGAAIMIFLAKRGRRTIAADQVTDYITYIVLGTMIGGRVGYALFYSPDLLTDFSSAFPYWGVLKVWEGGMASHGGMIGVFVAALLFARRHKLDWRHLGDLTVLGGSVGFFFGRLANFINGELFGRAAEGFKWAVKFPSEIFLWLQHDKGMSIAEFEGQTNLLSRLNETVQKAGINLEQWTSWVAE